MMKEFKHEIWIFLGVCLLELVTTLLIITSYVSLDLNGFAVEDGKIYLALSNRIEILEDGVCIKKIQISQFAAGSSYVFALENNQIAVYKSLRKEVFDMDGTLVEQLSYTDTSTINAKLKQKQIYTNSDGVVYQQKSKLGYYYLLNLQTNQVVYRMPAIDYCVKLLHYILSIILIAIILSGILKTWKFHGGGTIWSIFKSKIEKNK